jgi:hypothetical protein
MLLIFGPFRRQNAVDRRGAGHLKQAPPSRDGGRLAVVLFWVVGGPAVPFSLAMGPRRPRGGGHGVFGRLQNCLALEVVGRFFGVELKMIVQFVDSEEFTTPIKRTLDVLRVFGWPGFIQHTVFFYNKRRLSFGVQSLDVLRPVSASSFVQTDSRSLQPSGQRLTSSIWYSPALFVQPQKGQTMAFSPAIVL